MKFPDMEVLEMDERFKSLYYFFKTMEDTSVDIYCGNNPFFSREDLEEFTEEELSEIFNNACAEFACDSIEADWFNELFTKLVVCYGQQLKVAYVRREIARHEQTVK